MHGPQVSSDPPLHAFTYPFSPQSKTPFLPTLIAWSNERRVSTHGLWAPAPARMFCAVILDRWTKMNSNKGDVPRTDVSPSRHRHRLFLLRLVIDNVLHTYCRPDRTTFLISPPIPQNKITTKIRYEWTQTLTSPLGSVFVSGSVACFSGNLSSSSDELDTLHRLTVVVHHQHRMPTRDTRTRTCSASPSPFPLKPSSPPTPHIWHFYPCQDLASITQSELMRQVNDNSKNGECTLYRPATYTTIHVVSSLCTWGMIL